MASIKKALILKGWFHRVFVVGPLFFTVSCSHFVKRNLTDSKSISHEEVSSVDLYRQVVEGKKEDPDLISVVDSHPEVSKWIKYFTHSGRNQMQIYLERSSRYAPLMKSILKEEGLPTDLVYVALIESGFSPRALSRANAVGYWQFIYGTGKRFGLRIDGYVDERKDPVLSTRAAANFFRVLYSLFGSWPLALAAYNAGEYRVNRAVLRNYNRDFWFLSAKKALPKETRNYVPKFIASIHISKNPEKYGFVNIKYQKPIDYELIQLKSPISIPKLAKNMNIYEEELRALNPMYKGDYVPIYDHKTYFRVPVGLIQQAEMAVKKSFMKEPKYSYHYYYWYRVRSGDSLYRIARRHKTTVRKIRRANNLGSSSFLRVGQKLKIPTNRLMASKQSNRKPSSSPLKTKGVHIVKKGENLNFIASLYNLSLQQLKSMNNIQGNPLIYPGQKLKVTLNESSSKGTQGKKYHIVQKGETLIGIAKKYNTSLPQLMKMNSMSLQSVLLTGARLIIPK